MPSPAEQIPVLLSCVSDLQHGASFWTLEPLPRPGENPSPFHLCRSASAATSPHVNSLFLCRDLFPSSGALPHSGTDRTHCAPRCAPADPPAGANTERAQPRPGEYPAPERRDRLHHRVLPAGPSAALQSDPGDGGTIAGGMGPGVAVPQRLSGPGDQRCDSRARFSTLQGGADPGGVPLLFPGDPLRLHPGGHRTPCD